MNYAGLLKHQGAPAEQLLAALEKHGGALDGSDLGVGKTAQALAVVRARKLPTLVVGPLVAEAGWRKLGAHLGVGFSYVNYEMLRLGRTQFGRWENPLPPGGLEVKFKCSTCQIKLNGDPRTWQRCPHHYLGIHCVTTVKNGHNYGKFIFNHHAIKQLVFDEVHRASALDSLQASMLVAGKRQHIPTLGLSATVAENPLDFRALGYVLGLHSYTDFYAWASKRGCRRVPWGGFQFLLGEEKRKAVMVQLHNEIFPERGARVKIDDLGDEFPKVEITAELYDLAEADTISRLYAEMDESISALNERRMDTLGENPLTVLLRARQNIELLKVPIFCELAQDAVASGLHVAICVNFRSTVDELCRRLKTQCRVDGSQVGTAGAKRRAGCIEAFQRDDEPYIVLSAAAGSASIDLQDLHGKFPRVGFGSLGVSAQQTRQWCGRLRRATGKSKALYRFVLAANTPEVKIHRALAGKLDQIDCLNDGQLWAANLPLTHCNICDIYSEYAD